MRIDIRDSLLEVDPLAWNRLNVSSSPFLRHEFFVALEKNRCLGQRHGWYPRYFLLYSPTDVLLAAVPAFIKTNSYGEFVFDWAWAQAYQKQGLQYYPKMIVGVPYTPVSGHRLLIADSEDYDNRLQILQRSVTRFCQQQRLSSLHWLFTTEGETDRLEADGLMRRTGCQYHWYNRDYRNFEDFLSHLRAKRRKQIKRERRRAGEHGVHFNIKNGHALNDNELGKIHYFYRSTFERKWGEASLTQGFFADIARTMGEQLVTVLAKIDEQIIAAAVMFRDRQALYGRYWGCDQEYNSLHFETCFYQGIDYCIAQGLQRFEPGAQGEHKIWRGFLPTSTWSAHWIAHSGFRDAIARYLKEESELMHDQRKHLTQLSPFHRAHQD